MKSTYLDTPTAAVALNFKVASSSLSRAVIAAHHAAIEEQINDPFRVHYPAGKSADNTRWQGICPKINPADRPVVLLLLRDPFDKFRSACAESRVADVDAKLTELEAGFGRDMHFWPQSRLLYGVTKLYRFPVDMEDFANEAGLTYPLPDIDGGHKRPKPSINHKQLERLKTIYADDIALYESITKSGQISP